MQPTTISAFLSLLGLTSAVPLSARDDSAGCTDASFHNMVWTVEDFDFHASYIFTTPAHQNSWGYASFNLTNPALPYKTSCSAASSQLSDFFYGNQVFTCTLPEGETGSSATFNYSRPAGTLSLVQKWTCADQDPQYPITFGAVGNTTLDLQCTDETWQNPDWSSGQIYSSRTVTCDKVTTTVTPSEITAIA